MDLDTRKIILLGAFDKLLAKADHTQLRYMERVIKMSETFVKKNIDYGSSFQEPVGNVPSDICNWVRAGDKIKRIRRLTSGAEQMVRTESVQDTLEDLSVYCVLILLCMEDNSGIVPDELKEAFQK